MFEVVVGKGSRDKHPLRKTFATEAAARAYAATFANADGSLNTRKAGFLSVRANAGPTRGGARRSAGRTLSVSQAVDIIISTGVQAKASSKRSQIRRALADCTTLDEVLSVLAARKR